MRTLRCFSRRSLQLSSVERQYREYLDKLLVYLVYFFERTEPLQDLYRILSKALAALGLKSGGTAQGCAEKLFLTKLSALVLHHNHIDKLSKKQFLKGSPSSEENGAAATLQVDGSKDIGLLEAKITRLYDLLEETIVRTKENVEKKQALTYEEMEAEREEEETQADTKTESDDEDQQADL
ncbi:hypothetical protein SAY87_025360 [Trapa incisa]|uniref:SDE2/SF3A3 SAP domain-containing protein n=1 Tax=Trapa incisa TaxID=236973 RepID=A0AAN7JG48_9MYRT|nr:hypothetical protein SAY87_025360 [Trapa incisa]